MKLPPCPGNPPPGSRFSGKKGMYGRFPGAGKNTENRRLLEGDSPEIGKNPKL